MAGKAKGKKATKKKPKDVAAPPSKIHQLRNGITKKVYSPFFLFAAGIVLLSTSVVPYATRFLPDIDRRPEYLMNTADIEVLDPPHWVPQDIVQQAVSLAGMPEEISVLNEDITRQVSEAFKIHPWVKGNVIVRKYVPARIVVEMTYRRPVAMVEVKNGVLPIDDEGVLLPANDFAVADTKWYPLIKDITSTPQGATGTAWGDIKVETAAKVASYMLRKPKPHKDDPSATYWQQFGFDAIHISTRKTRHVAEDDIYFVFTTIGGSRVVWGRSPSVGPPIELAPEKKLGKLADYISRFGSFDGLHGPYEINITRWLQTTRKPLTAMPTRVLR